METAKEILQTAFKKEDAIEQAIDRCFRLIRDDIKKSMDEREFFRDADLRRERTINARQKQELDLAVRELLKARKMIAGMKELLQIKA
jgi:hypothetical protein